MSGAPAAEVMKFDVIGNARRVLAPDSPTV
jgi:hypothetical protein